MPSNKELISIKVDKSNEVLKEIFLLKKELKLNSSRKLVRYLILNHRRLRNHLLLQGEIDI